MNTISRPPTELIGPPAQEALSATNVAAQRYLVINDNDEVFATSLITRMLHDMGATRVDSTDDGEVALRHITKTGTRPDIIICALSVPKMDGIEFLRHLAEEQFVGGIILISNQAERMLRIAVNLAEAHRLNVLGFLAKPFTAPELLKLISRFHGLKEIFLPLAPSRVTPEALRTAIERDQMVPFFQSQIAVKTGKIVGVEVLARWQHPELGFVPPALFIPVAETHGLIGLLTQEILSKTLAHVAAWQKAGLTLPFALNFSARLLCDIDVPNRIEDELRRTGIDPANLTLEITESALCENMPPCLETLLRLRLKGIKLSIDDFGTGNSNLEQLHTLPFSELKIDRQFVTGAAKNEEARMFFQSAVTLAKQLKLSTVAECVESQDDLDVCAELGCDVAQGFFIGRPLPGKVFLAAAS